MSITRTGFALCLLALSAGLALANVPPNTPTITEPETDGALVSPSDVHMETTAFSDPNPDEHLCSDWEIRSVSPPERVWFIECIGGVERIHTHLGDGTFENSHAGRQELLFDTEYELQSRHRDDSGDPGTEWSLWANRSFETVSSVATFPLVLDDVLETPAPEWAATAGAPIVLPGAPNPPSLRIESAIGELLLEILGLDGVGNQTTNPAPLADHVPVRVVIDAGSTGGNLVLPESDLSLVDDEGETHLILLPAIDLAPLEQAYYWVSEYGATFVGSAGQSSPSYSTVARDLAVPWVARQPGYAIEIFAGGFQLPVNIAFVPDPIGGPADPYFYVTELYGKIKVVTRSGSVTEYATGLLNFSPTENFPGSGEQGLSGVVVDPATGDVFAAMLYDSSTSPGTHYPRVDRFISSDGGVTAATRTTILDMEGESQGQSHQISNLTIGPDGKLYVHMGDGFVTSTAQDLDSFRGKILRMNLDGSAATDNPFYDAGDGIDSRDYVFAYGVRNPFGGAWREADGFHYEVENGPSRDRFAKIVAGRNYLWNGSNGSMNNFAIYLWNPSSGPVNLAFVQPGTYGGSGFPIDKMDHAFVTESGPTYASGAQIKGKRISEVVVDAAGDLVSGPTPFFEFIGTGRATAVGLAAGPDGLYFTDLYKDLDSGSPIEPGANILRIRSLSIPRLELVVDPGGVSWEDLAGVADYDVVRGDLGTLRGTAGDFSQATTLCLADDVAATQATDTTPLPEGAGFWYLVRDLTTAGTGSYESGGTGQTGLRDPEIQAAATNCP